MPSHVYLALFQDFTFEISSAYVWCRMPPRRVCWGVHFGNIRPRAVSFDVSQRIRFLQHDSCLFVDRALAADTKIIS